MTVKKASNKAKTKTSSGRIHGTKANSRELSEVPATTSTGLKTDTVLTHEQIAERAKAIWRERGCVPGFDEQNWCEAETQLKEELETV